MNLPMGLLSTVLIVLLSIVGLVVIRKWLRVDELRAHHDVTDPMSQVVGMMFAVLIGFMVADSMQRFSTARTTVQSEASALANVFRLAHGLPSEARTKIEILCSRYADQVVKDEWPKLSRKQISVTAWKTYNKIWAVTTEFRPSNDSESNLHETILEEMAALGDNRRLRVEAMHNGLPPVLWFVLVVGGVVTVLFTYFFGVQSLRQQIIMTSMVSLVICLNIFLLATYDDPFSGDIAVTPDAFIIDQKIFETELHKLTPQGQDLL